MPVLTCVLGIAVYGIIGIMGAVRWKRIVIDAEPIFTEPWRLRWVCGGLIAMTGPFAWFVAGMEAWLSA